MENCASTLISKVSETVNLILGSCIPKRENDYEEHFDGPKDDECRKEELKQLVSMFASNAQNYIGCIRISLDDGKKLESSYKLDSKLEVLCIKTGKHLQEIPLSSVDGIYNFDDVSSDENMMQNKTIDTLTRNERSRFVMIEHFENGQRQRLFMLVEEVGNSDPFVTVLRILKMYADNKT
ncbi:conserved hypothetical protein [Theileria equi strain WA]|uniref:Uncharacterized protein n=1 Tax=Theileria equi strain WA TaxID=1537102 RepID=L1L9Y9_THEEQ|nr:conserved hypothetical protein [Theileria equi strain WA]EKX72064.1 conserved hypothetical protein [Theileria equi strain WA]|eukprot:XP_004831516.1 conserved hypothetical protein [Theileria equi strain WA]